MSDKEQKEAVLSPFHPRNLVPAVAFGVAVSHVNERLGLSGVPAEVFGATAAAAVGSMGIAKRRLMRWLNETTALSTSYDPSVETRRVVLDLTPILSIEDQLERLEKVNDLLNLTPNMPGLAL